MVRLDMTKKAGEMDGYLDKYLWISRWLKSWFKVTKAVTFIKGLYSVG